MNTPLYPVRLVLFPFVFLKFLSLNVRDWLCKQSLPEGGIKVFASQLHTHLTGLRAYTKHYRNGVELPELNRDDHYSPHYQEIRKLPRQVHVLPVCLSCYLSQLLAHDATAKCGMCYDSAVILSVCLSVCLSGTLVYRNY